MLLRPIAVRVLMATLALSLAAATMAEEAAPRGHGAKTDARKPGPGPSPSASGETFKPIPDAVSRHTLSLEGRQIGYTATAGTLPLAGPKGETTAHVFYTAYTVEPSGPTPRPVTFVFNGGPGAASAFLHIAAMGPRVVPFNEKGSAALEPVRLADNPDTWLEFTDLVFVDPVSTGYSRAIGGDEQAKEHFYGVDKDAEALTDFVRLWLTRGGRTLSPVFLAGESYGGFRVALLSKRLLAKGLDLRGAVLISPALEFSLVRGDSLMLLPGVLTLPAIAASHLELAGADALLEHTVAEVETFARTRYLTHLAAGMKDDPAIDAALARYTGLAVDQIARRHGRVTVGDFTRAYRRSNDRALSLYDGAVSIALPRPADGGEHHSHVDPILDRAVAVLTPAIVAYARGELGYATDLDYKLLNRSVSGKWDYGSSPQRQGFAGALDDLTEARTRRPSLRILITGGYTDLVTPFAASRFLVDQLEPIEGATAIDLKVYRGGHMMYLRAPSRKALADDARALYADTMR